MDPGKLLDLLLRQKLQGDQHHNAGRWRVSKAVYGAILTDMYHWLHSPGRQKVPKLIEDEGLDFVKQVADLYIDTSLNLAATHIATISAFLHVNFTHAELSRVMSKAVDRAEMHLDCDDRLSHDFGIPYQITKAQVGKANFLMSVSERIENTRERSFPRNMLKNFIEQAAKLTSDNETELASQQQLLDDSKAEEDEVHYA